MECSAVLQRDSCKLRRRVLRLTVDIVYFELSYRGDFESLVPETTTLQSILRDYIQSNNM